MNLSPHLKTRIVEAARREKSPSRAAAAWHAALVGAAALAFALFLFHHRGGMKIEPRPIGYLWGTVIGWSAVSIGATWLAFTRGRSMLGRKRGLLLASTFVTPVVLFGWMLLWNVVYPETLVVWPGRIGLVCLGLTLTMAAWPLVALAHVGRERNPAHPVATGAARGAALGALSGVLVDLLCPIANPAHVAVGHIFPMFVLMGVGALAGRFLTSVRAR